MAGSRQSRTGRPVNDILGKRFGRLSVLSEGKRGRNGSVYWLCRCDCGTIREFCGRNLRRMQTRSCGCLAREQARARAPRRVTTHGMYRTPEHVAWTGMLQRCLNERSPNYRRYGGRGIKVCDRWRQFSAFFADMGPKPSPQHSLDRYPDMNGNYEPGNCRWATPAEQTRNRRNAVVVTIGDESMSVKDWCQKLGLKEDLVRRRLRTVGWTPEEAFGLVERKRTLD